MSEPDKTTVTRPRAHSSPALFAQGQGQSQAQVVEKPGPPPNERQINLERDLSVAFKRSRGQVARTKAIFKDSTPPPAKDSEESTKQHRLRFHKDIEKISQNLLRDTDAAVEAYATGVPKRTKLNDRILEIWEFLGSCYLTCEKYETSEEQYRKGLGGWLQEKEPPGVTEDRKMNVRKRMLFCRRGMAIAKCRGARSKSDPQKTRLEALRLIMESINGGENPYLSFDVRCCNDSVAQLIEGTYPPPGSGEDDYEVCEAHVTTLAEGSAILQTNTEEAKPELGVFILRMRVRMLELLVYDLGDLGSASIIYRQLKLVEPESYTEKITDDKLKDLVKRLLVDMNKFFGKAEQSRRMKQRWTSAAQAARSLKELSEVDVQELPPSPSALRKTNTGLTTITEVSEFTEEDDADDNNYRDFLGDGTHGEVMEADDARNSIHWHKKWLKSMKEFSEKTLRNAPGIGPKLAVKLTVIDTGIHISHPKLKDRDWSGRFRDFSKLVEPLEGTSEEDGPTVSTTQGSEEAPADEDGHGTFIAGLLLELVPNLDLYIARIGTTRDNIGNDEDVGYKIGKAIKHAITAWHTEIISISIGCQESDAVRDAVRDAIRQNVIVLAASGNWGDSRKLLYPAKEDRVFKIYSASDLGKPSEISGTPGDLKFSFYTVGQDIPSIWPGQLIHKLKPDVLSICFTKEKEDKKREKRRKAKGPLADQGQIVEHKCSEKCNTSVILSGTSFAAPIAAAIVAIIYQFYNTWKMEIDGHKLKGCEGLKSINSVRSILMKMGSPKGAGTVVFLQAPSHRTAASHFHFQPVDASRRQLREGDKNVFKQTYDQFLWSQLVRVINDGQ